MGVPKGGPDPAGGARVEGKGGLGRSRGWWGLFRGGRREMRYPSLAGRPVVGIHHYIFLYL